MNNIFQTPTESDYHKWETMVHSMYNTLNERINYPKGIDNYPQIISKTRGLSSSNFSTIAPFSRCSNSVNINLHIFSKRRLYDVYESLTCYGLINNSRTSNEYENLYRMKKRNKRTKKGIKK